MLAQVKGKNKYVIQQFDMSYSQPETEIIKQFGLVHEYNDKVLESLVGQLMSYRNIKRGKGIYFAKEIARYDAMQLDFARSILFINLVVLNRIKQMIKRKTLTDKIVNNSISFKCSYINFKNHILHSINQPIFVNKENNTILLSIRDNKVTLSCTTNIFDPNATVKPTEAIFKEYVAYESTLVEDDNKHELKV